MSGNHMSEIARLLKFFAWPGSVGFPVRIGDYERMFSGTVLGDENIPCLAFWRGRVALWSIIRALGLEEGDEVLLPAYTCEMVPAAVRFAGAKCSYVDLAPGQFNPTWEDYASAITSRTRVILCQHTYGLRQPVDIFRKRLEGRKIVIVEDCCQFVGFDESDHVAKSGAAAFFSNQWTKPLSTGLGGIASFNNPVLYKRVLKARGSFSTKGHRRRERSLALQMIVHKFTVNEWTRPVMASVYRWMQKAGLVHGTTAAAEYGESVPEDYAAAPAVLQSELGMRGLENWRQNVSRRREQTELFMASLSEMSGGTSKFFEDGGCPPLWSVPMLVENKDELLQHARRAGLPLSTWFNRIPAHVAPSSAGIYDYEPGLCENTEKMFEREIHLMTGPAVSLNRAQAALKMLKKCAIFSKSY